MDKIPDEFSLPQGFLYLFPLQERMVVYHSRAATKVCSTLQKKSATILYIASLR